MRNNPSSSSSAYPRTSDQQIITAETAADNGGGGDAGGDFRNVQGRTGAVQKESDVGRTKWGTKKLMGYL